MSKNQSSWVVRIDPQIGLNKDELFIDCIRSLDSRDRSLDEWINLWMEGSIPNARMLGPKACARGGE